MTSAAGPLRLQSIRDRTLLVTPVRLGLGLVWAVVAQPAGADAGPAWLAFFVAVFLTAAVLIADPRSRLAELKDPVEAPPGAEVDRPLRQAVSALLPSTVVVNVLAAVALAREPLLTALLESHFRHTGSKLAERILDNWEVMVPSFVKVMPTEYKRVLQQRRAQRLPFPGAEDVEPDALAAKGVSRG